jgi:transcriptional antiterminator RfaH
MKDSTHISHDSISALQDKLAEKWHDKWMVAYTKPRQEQIALQNLERQNFEAYLPLYKKFKNTETGSVPVFEPMFPRYILFRPSKPEQSIESVRSTKGISHVVRFGFEPGVVGQSMIDTLKSFEEAQNQASLVDMSNFKAGQKVKLKHVALGNMEGLVQSVSSKRVAVLLEILGRPTVVQMEHHQIEVLS